MKPCSAALSGCMCPLTPNLLILGLFCIMLAYVCLSLCHCTVVQIKQGNEIYRLNILSNTDAVGSFDLYQTWSNDWTWLLKKNLFLNNYGRWSHLLRTSDNMWEHFGSFSILTVPNRILLHYFFFLHKHSQPVFWKYTVQVIFKHPQSNHRHHHWYQVLLSSAWLLRSFCSLLTKNGIVFCSHLRLHVSISSLLCSLLLCLF